LENKLLTKAETPREKQAARSAQLRKTKKYTPMFGEFNRPFAAPRNPASPRQSFLLPAARERPSPAGTKIFRARGNDLERPRVEYIDTKIVFFVAG